MDAESARLAIADALEHDDVKTLKKVFENGRRTFDAALAALMRAIQAKSSKCVKFLLDTALDIMKKSADVTMEQKNELTSMLSSAISSTRDHDGSAPTSTEAKMENKKIDAIANVEGALEDVKAGKFVIVQDAASRENEGDLIIAAEKVTPEKMAFMVNYTSGIICVGITSGRCEELELPQMVVRNTESHGTAFTVSIDYKHGTSTGISAADRTKTILAMVDGGAKPEDFARPGHIFPLRAKSGGVLERPGHTETSVDLPRLAGLKPAGVMSEIVNRDGSMSRTGELKAFAERFNLRMITIEEIIEYRREKNL